MIGNLVRLTRVELETALADADWVREFVDSMLEEDEEDPRHLCVGKAWHALGFLTGRLGFPVDVVCGEQEVPWDEEWGYGPLRYLTPEQVEVADKAVRGVNVGELLDGVSAGDLVAAEVYPVSVWEDEFSFEFVSAEYVRLGRFLRAAAWAGNGVIAWID
ncbi:YfbM family protein [Actinosynnema sp. NPDC020468]|uniref:YfbM family protein n=1 Tax=Actinosynnema sp. NPDC020468 TaxID=3154488 RepID=UPI0033CC042F